MSKLDTNSFDGHEAVKAANFRGDNIFGRTGDIQQAQDALFNTLGKAMMEHLAERGSNGR